MSFGRPDLTNVWRRARQFGAAPVAIAALLFGAVRCADLTAPAAVGNISIFYADTVAFPVVPHGVGAGVDYAVGLEIAPKFAVMIGSTVQPRARYVYSRASADSGRVAISQNGNAVRVIRPGIDTIIATVVGATIGGPTNGAKLADTLLVFASADSLMVERRNVTFTAITAVDTLDAAALATDNTPIPGVPIQWTSQNPAVVSVTQLGGGESAVLQAQANGTAIVRVQFAGFAFIDVNVTVQQTFKRYFLSPPATAFASKTATASVTAVAQDSLNQTFVAGTPPAFQYVSSAPGKVSIDPSSGLMRAVDNTAGTDAEITAQISGVVASNTVTAAVAQDATTIDIQSQDPRTISSIGGTLQLGVIVRDALNQDWTKEEVLWTTSNSGKATAVRNGLTTIVTAQDTGQVYVVAKADNAVDSILVIISNDPATVELSPDPFALTSLNQTGTLTATVKNAAGTTLTSGFTLTWVSRDSNVVEPQPTAGQMLARSLGEARIVVTTNNNVSDSLTVRVTNAPDTVRIIPDTLFFSNVGDVNSTFAVDFKNGLGAVLGKSSVAWSTANTNIAQVAVGTGAITAIGSGTTYVLAVSPENALRRDSVYVVVTNNAASMNVTPGTTQTLTAFGATLPFSATVFNAAGNPISGAPVAWSVPVGGAFLSIDAVTGVATALANGTATVRATSGSVTRDVTVNVAQAFSSTRSTITPAAASIVANGTSSTVITVQLKDANDNNLTFGGANVVLAASIGTLGLVSDVGNGRYTATLTSSTTMGTSSVSGSANTVAISTPGLVSFTAGTAAKYLVTSTSVTPVAGSSVTIRAQLADNNNNPVATSGIDVTFASTNGGTFTGANPASTDGTGVAQITFNTSATVASHTISATGGGLSGSSPAINSVAAGADNYLVTPASTSPAAGSTVLVTAQLRDANGNAVALPTQTVNWSLTNANGSFSGSATASTSTDNAGVASVVLNVSNGAGVSTQVRANFGSAPAGTSATITTVAGASGLITVEQSPTANPQSGVIFGIQPTVQLRDAQGNPVSQANVTVIAALTSGTGTLTASPAQTNGSGLATFAGMKIDGPTGPKTITFSVSGVGTANAGVTLAAGSASQMALNAGDGQSAIVNTTVGTPPSVTVRDASNNPVQGTTVTFAIGFGNGQFVAGAAATTNASGVAAVDSWTLGGSPGLNTLTATVAGLAGSPVTFSANGTVGAAAGATTTITAAPTSVAADGAATSTITVQAKDAGGNNLTTEADAVVLTANPGAVNLPVTPGPAGTGTYTATLPGSSTAGLVTITGTINAAAITDNATVNRTDASAPQITGPSGGAGATNSAANVAENVTAIHTFTANEGVTWSLTGGADQARFSIVAGTGVLTFSVAPNFEAPTDADANNTYVVVVTATDGSSNASSQTVTVTVTDVSESAGFTIDAIADASVAENAAYTSVTPNLSGATPIGTVTYTLSGVDAAAFTVDPSTGVVSMVTRNFESPVDANSDNAYQVTLVATDSDGNSDSHAWTVTVTDAVEGAAFTINDISNTSVLETSPYTSVTPGLSGPTPIGTVTWSISGGADALDFTINANTGVVSMIARDFENPEDANSNNVYELTITATDSDLNTDSEDWTVTVTNIGIAINPIANTSVNENAAYTSVTPVLTGDTPAGTVTYTLSGLDAADFTIDPSTGVVSMVARNFEAPVDANTDNVYEVTITATDAEAQQDSEVWTVTVLGLDDTAPTITSSATPSVAENTANPVHMMTATDPDSPAPTWSLTGGADQADFTINPTTGELSFVVTPNFEAPHDADPDNVYEVQVTATDAGSNVSIQTLTVTVTDVAPTVVGSAAFSVVENTSGTIQTYTSADPASITWSITGGADAGDFTINPSTGELSFNTAPDFDNPADAGTDNVYDVVVTADDGTSVANLAVAVTVTDLDDTAPSITSSATPSVAENTANPVHMMTATDPDSPAPTWSLTGGADQGAFTINPTTGELSFVVTPNFEAPHDADPDNVYEVQVTATDAGSNVSAQTVTITITDIAPTVVGSTAFSVLENTSTTIQTYTSADPASVTWSITGTDAAAFTINPATGELSFTPAPDFEAPTDVGGDNVYDLTVSASDGTSTTNQPIVVTVTDDAGGDDELVQHSSAEAILSSTLALTASTEAKPSVAKTQPLSDAKHDYIILPHIGVSSLSYVLS